MVKSPSRNSGSGRETLPEVRKFLGDPPGGSEVVGRQSRRCGTGQETIPEDRKWSETIPEVCNWL